MIHHISFSAIKIPFSAGSFLYNNYSPPVYYIGKPWESPISGIATV
jgi:hypothetical protein